MGGAKFFCCQGRANFVCADGTGPRSFVALVAALASLKGLIPDEKLACGGLFSLHIPFLT